MAQVTIDQAVEIARAHHLAGRLADAESMYRQILSVQPNHADVLHFLGLLAYQSGQAEAALELIAKSVAANPNVMQAHYHQGNVLKALGRLDEAIASYRRAIELDSSLSEPFNNLGNVLRMQGKPQEAMPWYAKAIEVQPTCAEAYVNLGNVLHDLGRSQEAIAAHSKAIQLKPTLAEAHYNLGNIYKDHGLTDEAIAAYRRAIELNPARAEAWNNLANVLKDQGLLDDALSSYGRAIALQPGNAEFDSNRLYAMHFHPRMSSPVLYAEHVKWNQRHAVPLRQSIRPHMNDRAVDRPLKVGYVSPDFRSHAVGRFMLPLLAQHDRTRFEIVCYSGVAEPDQITDRLRGYSGLWRNIVGKSDAQVADAVREDQIDVLVDLTMHMAGSRLLVFARKPAPVQVTYLAYCSTTGLDSIDYRLTDPYLDPVAGDQGRYSERSMWLPRTYWCYEPGVSTSDVGPLPALASVIQGSDPIVTFGCLNNFAKVSPAAFLAWCEILRQVPRSRLLLHAMLGSHRQRLLDVFRQQGIDPARLEFIGPVSPEAYFELYQRIDIGLDPFPCAGGTTTCDALWMGVPVVTLAGKTAVGRSGVSILNNMGHSEWIAPTSERYVHIAVSLARDLSKLAEVRANLRRRLLSSPLTDAPQFARDVEAAYRQMWQQWAAGVQTPS